MKRTSIILSVAMLASLLSLEVAAAQENRPLGPAPLVHDDGSPSAAKPSGRGVIGGMILPLAGVLAMIAACGYAFRVASAKSGGLMGAMGAGGRAPSGVLSVLGRYPVSRGSTLVLLKVDRRVLLISQSSSRTGGVGMQTLCEITDPEEVASILIKTRDDEEASKAKTFEKILRESDRRTATVVQPAVDLPGVSSLRQRLSRISGGAA
jgi:flagellar biogenesis protein FliO